MEVLHLDEHLFRSFIHMDENVALGWNTCLDHSSYGWKCSLGWMSLGFICKTSTLNMLPTIIWSFIHVVFFSKRIIEMLKEMGFG
jgi:hypothetical protein